ncbi:hypothetical protein DV737_g4765, partial [Chaetothyriales sp. CBS 132003]
MDFVSFLTYLHLGAPSTFLLFISCLSNSDIKSLRLAFPPLSSAFFPYLFRRIYFSAHETDVAIFKLISINPRLRVAVNEIIWDDTIFDRWITGIETYTDRLSSITPLPSNVLKRDKAIITEAYLFWASEAAALRENLSQGVDRQLLEKSISSFSNLRQITLMSRSRLTYVDLDDYWDHWQTPRSRAWKKTPFARHLIPPEPFKPSSGTTVRQSEGIRPMEILLNMASRHLKLGALVVSLIGGGQTRASGGMNVNRYKRKWHIDLSELTKIRNHDISAGKIALHLLIEQQTEDIFRQENLWETLIDQTLQAGSETLEELSMSNICLDWFWDYLQSHRGRMLEKCKALKRVDFEGGWCENPAELLKFLRSSTAVKAVSITSMDVEGTSFYGLLHHLRQANISFDQFEIRSCRCPTEFYPHQVDIYPYQVDNSWTAPWDGPSDKLVPWLKGEQVDFPLSQGPG